MVNMENINKMCDWERKKAIYLLSVAENLGMNTSGYGEVAVNPNSGYTYLWIEDYNFCLYMPINCKLQKSDIEVSWTCPEDGEEIETTLNDQSLEDLEEWAQELSEEHEKLHNN